MLTGLEKIPVCVVYDVDGVRHGELPENARRYLEKLEEISGCRISAIGVGPGREQTIVVRDLIEDEK